jgi:hypothetical protein
MAIATLEKSANIGIARIVTQQAVGMTMSLDEIPDAIVLMCSHNNPPFLITY